MKLEDQSNTLWWFYGVMSHKITSNLMLWNIYYNIHTHQTSNDWKYKESSALSQQFNIEEIPRVLSFFEMLYCDTQFYFPLSYLYRVCRNSVLQTSAHLNCLEPVIVHLFSITMPWKSNIISSNSLSKWSPSWLSCYGYNIWYLILPKFLNQNNVAHFVKF